eukprot:TRINITY_DN169_c0_g1_i1.p1 TRINITY_DN169_c0_g1~~TRINITY_DN169_c0_g1_i1.p1  ORF type:complete len:118 (-),score=12.98 TRINITY_DN169_c0_g1_i1:10-363(-)
MSEEHSKALFRAWDVDQDNEISSEDVAAVLKESGLPHSDEDIASMIKGLDPRSTGTVSLQQFIDACSRKNSRQHSDRPSDEVSDMVSSLARKRSSFEPMESTVPVSTPSEESSRADD